MKRIVTITTLVLAITATSVKAAPPKAKSAAVVVASTVEASAPVVEAPAAPAGPTPLEQIYTKREEQKVLVANLESSKFARETLLNAGTVGVIGVTVSGISLIAQAATPARENSTPMLVTLALGSLTTLLGYGGYLAFYGDTYAKQTRVLALDQEIDVIVAPSATVNK